MNDTSIVKRALEIVEKALEFPVEAQQGIVEQACDGDAKLRREVESMLALDGGVVIEEVAISDVLQDPSIQSTSPERYKLLDEIGRGGMGTVFRAHDRRLDRDVAIKVMRDGASRPQEMQGRFAVEAQIGARLQHPGIAPVYDLGQLSDGRVFFAMKLVAGETMASLLSARSDPTDDRSRLLGVFEQLSQTIAYAHSHGIIHRDLKPDNVMVGEFGEVQVMDWGLAKALSEVEMQNAECVDLNDGLDSPSSSPSWSPSHSTETRIGTVMGTPAYMPPEQAVGKRGKPTDVFSLGAILCEILTGAPPYTAESPAEVYNKSAKADLQEAIARLEACQADTELIELSKQCLEPNSDDRPSDAGEVAHRFSSYLQTVQSRLREAEIAAARSAAAALEEKKRRRVTRTLMATALVLVTVVLGAWVWVSRQRAQHSDDVAALETQQRAVLEDQVYRLKMATAFPEFESEHYERTLQILESTSPRSRGWEWHYLRAQLDQSVRPFSHTEQVSLCAMVRDEDMILAVDRHNVAQVWQRSTGEAISSKTIGKGRPVAIAPNGRWILSQRKCPVLWDGLTGEIIREFQDWPTPLEQLGKSAVSEDGAHIALADGGLRLFDARSGQLLHSFETTRVLASTFSADGEWLIWCDRHVIKFWDIEKSQEARSPIRNVSVGWPGDIALSPDRSLLALPSKDHVVVWNLDTDERRKLHVDLHTTALTDVGLCFNEASTRLITVGNNDAIRVWDPKDGRLLQTLMMQTGEVDGLRDLNLTDGLLALPADDGVRLWDVREQSPLELRGHDSFVYPVAISPDGGRIASGSWDHTVRLWNAETGEQLAVLGESRVAGPFIHDLAFDPQRERLVSASSTGNACIWDSITGDLLRRLEVDGQVYAADYTMNGADLLLVHGGITVVDAESLEVKEQIPHQQQSGLCVNASGSLFLTWYKSYSDKRTVTLWDSSSLSPIARFEAPRKVASATFTPDGARLLLGHVDGVITFWDAENLDRPMNEMSGHAGEIFALRHLPDGSKLLSAGRDATIRVWDVKSGDIVGTLRGHDDYVYSLAVSPDGQRVVSGSGDSTVRIWETSPLGRRLRAIRDADEPQTRRVKSGVESRY